MKNILITIITISLLSFTLVSVNTESTVTAKPNQEQGIYIFMDSKPMNEYEYLGSIKLKVLMTGKYSEAKNAFLKKIKKDYPNANGALITDDDGFRIDAILIKE